MRTVPLRAIPNQSLTFTQDGNRYALTIKEVGGTMAMDININDTDIVTGIELAAGNLPIPYRYLENGNFTFVTQDEEIPYYRNFGMSQQLVYIPQSELDSNR